MEDNGIMKNMKNTIITLSLFVLFLVSCGGINGPCFVTEYVDTMTNDGGTCNKRVRGFPLIINPPAEFLEETLEIANDINNELGVYVFSVSTSVDRKRHDVVNVYYGDLTHKPDNRVGEAQRRINEISFEYSEHRVILEQKFKGNVEFYRSVLKHELGHVLGFVHEEDLPEDKRENSIMNIGDGKTPHFRQAYVNAFWALYGHHFR